MTTRQLNRSAPPGEQLAQRFRWSRMSTGGASARPNRGR